MQLTTLRQAALVALSVGATAVAAVAQDAAGGQDMAERVSLAQSWLDGALDSYGDHEISYDGDPIELRYTSHLPEMSFAAKSSVKALEVLEKMSGGKIEVSTRFNGVVHGVAEGFEATRSGITDIALCFTDLEASSFPLTGALTLPGLFANESVQAIVAENLAQKYFREEFERQGVYILGMMMSSPGNIYSNVPITSLEELEGKKIRTTSGIDRDIYNALGATTVTMSSGDFYSAMQRGLVDGTNVSNSAARIFRVNEVAKHITATPIQSGPIEWCMNQQAYDDLPADLQKVVYDWGRQMTIAMTQIVFTLDSAKAVQQFREEGLEYHELSAEEWSRWQDGWEPVIDAYIADGEAKGLPMQALVDEIKVLADQYGDMSLNEIMQDALDNPAQGVAPLASN